MKYTAMDVVNHLRPHCDVVKPIRVTFAAGLGKKEQVVEGAYYEQTCLPPAGSQSAGVYRRFGMQLLEVPKCYVKRKRVERKLLNSPTVIVPHKVCFVVTGTPHDDSEWYVAAYYLDAETKMQPFAENCILCPWNIDSKIDDYSRKPYDRVTLNVEDLTNA